MYFAPERAKRVIENLYRSLVEGGWLIVSPTEASTVLFSKFKTVNFPGVILYQKGAREISGLESVVLMETFPYPQPSYQKGRYSETAEILSRQEEDLKAVALRARACANQGKIEEARKWIEQAIEADKLNAAFHFLRATILQELGEIETAIASLKRALYIDPNFVLAHFMLGTLAVRQGKAKESQRHFDCALLLLKGYQKQDLLPESDGITAGRLIEIIESRTCMEESA